MQTNVSSCCQRMVTVYYHRQRSISQMCAGLGVPIFTALVIHFVDGSSLSRTSGSPAHLTSTSSSAHQRVTTCQMPPGGVLCLASGQLSECVSVQAYQHLMFLQVRAVQTLNEVIAHTETHFADRLQSTHLWRHVGWHGRMVQCARPGWT